VLLIGTVHIKKFLVWTTPKSIGLMAHRTRGCLETKEAFKAAKAGSGMALPFYSPTFDTCYLYGIPKAGSELVISFSNKGKPISPGLSFSIFEANSIICSQLTPINLPIKT
jgi:hypothetical protein